MIIRKEDLSQSALELGIWDELTGGNLDVDSVSVKITGREDERGTPIQDGGK